MSGGIMFDNILVSHDEAAALEFGKQVHALPSSHAVFPSRLIGDCGLCFGC